MEKVLCKKEFEDAKLLLKQRHYYKAINLLKELLISSEKTEKDTINTMLFDAYVSVREFVKADEVLRSMLAGYSIDRNELEYRKDLLNSHKAKRYNVSLEVLDGSNVYLSKNVNLSYVRGVDLIRYQICFDYKPVADNVTIVMKSHSNDELFKFTDINTVEKKDNSNRYNLSINALFIDKIGVLDNVTGSIKWLISIKLEGIINIIRGKEGWLFLNNDTNNSVSQFKGDYLISDDEIAKWRYYLSKLAKINNSILLIPPSKEMVFSEYYPYSRGAVCPIDQLNKLINEVHVDYYYPIDDLREDRNSYSKTESHWCNKAACDVILKVFSKLNISLSNFQNPYTFELINQVGDLGSKCQPPEKSFYYKYKNDINHASVVFSNEITTQGSVIKYLNSSAFIDKTIVIFGDSFIDCCLSLITSIFTNVVRIRSNATLIQEVIDYEQPDCVLAEITERFIVRAPSVVNKIKDYTPTLKTSNLSTITWSTLMDYNDNPRFGIYNDYMLDYQNIIEMTRFDSLSQSEKQIFAEVEKSGLFDPIWYSNRYMDVSKSRLPPLLHYIYKGWIRGYNPSELFNTNFYLNTYLDVKKVNICPLVHFVKYGRKEGRKIRGECKEDSVVEIIKNSGLFNEEWYRNSYPEVALLKTSAINHYVMSGWKKGYNPSMEFDTLYYLNTYPDVKKANVNPLLHYILFGKKEGRQSKNFS